MVIVTKFRSTEPWKIHVSHAHTKILLCAIKGQSKNLEVVMALLDNRCLCEIGLWLSEAIHLQCLLIINFRVRGYIDDLFTEHRVLLFGCLLALYDSNCMCGGFCIFVSINRLERSPRAKKISVWLPASG